MKCKTHLDLGSELQVLLLFVLSNTLFILMLIIITFKKCLALICLSVSSARLFCVFHLSSCMSAYSRGETG